MGHHRIAKEFTPHGIGVDGDGREVESILLPDIDGEGENLADAAGITLAQAAAALLWMRQQESNETFRAAGILVARLVALIVPPDPTKIDPHLCGMRFLGVASLLGKIGTLTELARRAEVSRQLLHFHAQKIADGLGFHGFAQKRSATRETYAAAMRESWAGLSPEERRRRRMGLSQVAEDAATDQAEDALDFTEDTEEQAFDFAADEECGTTHI